MATINSSGIADANRLRQHFEAISLSLNVSAPTSERCAPTPENKQSIIIVGAGAFGSSLALELVTHYRDTYFFVDVFDKWPIPSKDAASTDTAKIIRADYAESIYATIATEAIELWKTDLFKGTYHQTGWIIMNDASDDICFSTLQTLRNNNLAEGLIEFSCGREVTQRWQMIDGPMEGEIGYFNPHSGWANSAQATFRVACLAQQKGARFHTGQAGNVISLLYNSTGNKIVGVRTKSGSTFYGDKIVLCTGAWTNSIIDTKGQLVPKGHCLSHIQLTPEEHKKYANIPVLVDSKWEVYCFRPFENNGVMKVAVLSSGYVSKGEPWTQSDHSDDGIPKEAEEHIKRGLRAMIPELAIKEMFDVRICWCVDTPDSHFLITPHPDMEGLYLATGGSGHGFKFLPRIGHYIALMLEKKLPPEYEEVWKWRQGTKFKKERRTEWTLASKNVEETEGWVGSARHGVMAHTWGNE